MKKKHILVKLRGVDTYYFKIQIAHKEYLFVCFGYNLIVIEAISCGASWREKS